MNLLFLITTSLILVFSQKPSEAVNILGITNCPSPSHHIWNERLLMALAKRGHNVTMVSHDAGKEKHENFHLIQIQGIYEILHEDMNLEAEPTEGGNFAASDIFEFARVTCDHDLKSPQLNFLLNYPKDFKFDLIIWDTLSPECLYPLVKRFGNPRLVGLSAYGMQPYLSQIMGLQQYAYFPYATSTVSDNMSFSQKLTNLYYNFDCMWEKRKNMKLMKEKAIAKFGEDIDDFDEVEKMFDIFLVNYDPVMDYPQPLPPSVIAVGGMQVKPPNPLPADLKKAMDGAKNGVIFFSLGTNIKSEKIDKRKMEAFTKCFETLPYKVLWKIKDPNFDIPKNVFIKSWFPQGDILAQKNTKLFITHGGGLSTQESMYHGVPMLILPFFMDQFNNAFKMELRKVGKRLHFSKLTPDYVCDNIKLVLNEKIYRENVQLISKRIKDQPQSAVERAVFWTEHVLRQGNSSYLSLTTRKMGFIQVYNLDIFLLGVVIITSGILVVIFIISRCFCKKATSQQRKTKRE